MYCIVVYDINKKRVNKVLKHFRQYLFRIQNSVFEGEIRESTYKEMCKGLKPLINKKEDSVIIFTISSEKYVKKKTIGKPTVNLDNKYIISNE